MNNNLIIQDWTGNIRFKGHYTDPKIDQILALNKCKSCTGHVGTDWVDECCSSCGGTGYSGDFYVYWEDQDNAPYENVYECINY